jgi:DNA-binding LacI/PurR family transcriptional regulator
MTTEQLLLNKWQKLDHNKQEKVLAFMDSLVTETPETPETTTYQPQTELGKKLWELRLKSLGKQPLLNTWEEVEEELASRRGGIQE